MTEAEELSKYELTEAQILDIMNLDPKLWRCKKNFSTNAVNNLKTEDRFKNKNVQLYEWEFQKKEGKKWVTKKLTFNGFFATGKLYNTYAVSGDNGIVIIRPASLAKAEGLKPSPASTGSSPSASSDFSGSFDSSFSDMSMMNAAPSWMEPTGIRGEDEKIIQDITFAKLCLLKECYESLGILL